MDKSEILEKVNAIFVDVLNNEGLVLTYETTAVDVEDWDSLNNIHLLVAIEKHFNMRFTSREIQKWNNVGEMVNAISAKLN
jgi:acyl carrier protein